MDSKSKYLALAALTIFAMSSASAQQQNQIAQAIDVSSVLDMMKATMAPAIDKLTANAISWLGAFATLQFFITNYKLLTSDADLQTAVAKFFGSIAWVGVCIYIIQNGPSFIAAVGDSLFNLLGSDLPSPGSIIGFTLGASTKLAIAAVVAGSIPLAGGVLGQFLLYACLGVAAIGMYFAFKIFMLQLELALIAMLSPLSFSFLGLNTLRDQGIAPFKALLSLAYRVILLSVIYAGFGQVSNVLRQTIDNVDPMSFVDGIGKALGAVLAAGCAYLLLAYLAFKSDSIAANLASGNTSMGTGDVASAAAAGAAMGAAVASGGAAVAGASSSAPQSMRDFLGSMMGGGGSVSNASAMGSAEPPPLPSPGSASFSVGGQRNGSVGGAGGPSGQAGSSSSNSASSGGEVSLSQPGQATPDAGSNAGREVAAPQQAEKVASGRIGPDLSGEGGGQAQGSGQTASISGAGGTAMADLSKAIDNLAGQVAQGSAPKKPGLRDRLGEANRHMEKEQSTVGVSINPHHHD